MARRQSPSTLITVSRHKQTITQDQLIALKDATAKKQQFCPVRSTINTINSLLSVIKDSFVGQHTYHCRCEGYGHTPDHSNWTNRFPRCQDCGVEITSPDQLRKSVAVTFNAKHN